MLAWAGEAPSSFGKLRVEGRRYYAGHCTLQLTAGGPIGKADPAQVERFLDSAKRVDAGPGADAPALVATPPPPPPATRADKPPVPPPTERAAIAPPPSAPPPSAPPQTPRA
jgi:hypothetical protein